MEKGAALTLTAPMRLSRRVWGFMFVGWSERFVLKV
jgi:hypothetical protein